MAVLALGLVGAAIAPAGYAAVGWAIGSLAGQYLFQKKSHAPNIEQQGPRMGDTRVQAATYGVAIPSIEGAMRAAGNIIWTSGIRETVVVSTEEVGGGGKGGGGQSQQVTTTTYLYDVDLAIGLCAPPSTSGIGGVRRIWANGTLIYNVGASADTATLIASNQNAQNIRFEYPGHCLVRRVSRDGTIRVLGKQIFDRNTLQEEEVGLEEVDDGVYDLYFCFYQIGRFTCETTGSRILCRGCQWQGGRSTWHRGCYRCRENKVLPMW